MIRVTVEMLRGGIDRPGGNEILGVMLIDNKVIKTLQTGGIRGDYGVRLWKKRDAANVIAGVDCSPPFQADVIDFPRKSYHVWNLVRKALTEIATQRGSI